MIRTRVGSRRMALSELDRLRTADWPPGLHAQEAVLHGGEPLRRQPLCRTPARISVAVRCKVGLMAKVTRVPFNIALKWEATKFATLHA